MSRSNIRAAIGESQEVHFVLQGCEQKGSARARAHVRSTLGARHERVAHVDREQVRYHSDAQESLIAHRARVSGQRGRFA